MAGGEIETKLKIAAVATTQTAFRDIAQQVEQMTQRVTKSQRALTESHRQAAASFASLTSLGKEGLKALGVGFGAAEAVAVGKESVLALAAVDKQARQTSLNLRVSKEAMKAYYAEAAMLAEKMGGVGQEYRNAFDTLAQAFGPEKARAMLAPVAAAATETGTNIADVAQLATQMVESHLSQDIAVLFIEHDMDVVFRFARRIIVMVGGRIMLQGSPQEIAADPRVREVYLGGKRHG